MRLIVNGRKREFDGSTLYDLCASMGKKSEECVLIYNGFQTSEDRTLCEEDHVAIIEKGQMPDEGELEALMSARHTPMVHEKVKQARVAIAGLGGLGSHISIELARTGVGHLHLVDFDVVEPSNLNRQMYKIKHLGRYKTDALAEEIHEINPYIQVTTDCIRVTEETAVTLFARDEIVCEAFDRPEAKAMLLNTLLENNQKVIVVAASGMAGYESSNEIQTRKISKQFYLCGDGISGAKPGMGLLAPRVSICAGHQANMVLRLILGIEQA